MRNTRYVIVAVSILLTCCARLAAQNNLAAERDSLIGLIAKAPDDTAKANNYIKLLANYYSKYFYQGAEDSVTYFKTAAAAARLCKN
ncbi:hypothetical protein [Niastella populi]|uniref:Uncharacterized protein n=1 Tax=Niastella populi TaxID=550983 RepID=A0A1V9GCZ3_9BACT|nr:hypothetical protein [Niastella populi]OQP68328.1 hypothetical protein A4R26_00530 [Niastella populi]